MRTDKPIVDIHSREREDERARAVLLAAPFFLTLLLPIVGAQLATIAGVHGVPQMVENFVEDNKILCLLVVAATLPPLLYAFYTIVGKGVWQIARNEQYRAVERQFMSDYHQPHPRWVQLTLWLWVIGVVLIVGLIIWLHAF